MREVREKREKKKTPSRMRRRKSDPLASEKSAVDYKNIELLSKFLTEKGKVIPRRISGCSAKNQRRLTHAIRRARHVGFLPFQAE